MLLKVCLISLLVLSITADSARYKADSERRSKLALGSNEVVFFGTSTIEHWPIFPVINSVNRGIAGETTTQLLSRFQQDVIALKPKVVALYFGTNDLINAPQNVIQVFEENVRNIHNLARNHNIRIVQLALHSVCGDHKVRRPHEYIVYMNNFLKQLCDSETENTCVYVDTHKALADTKTGDLVKTFTEDCLKPNAQAYLLLNPLVKTAIARVDKSVDLRDQILRPTVSTTNPAPLVPNRPPVLTPAPTPAPNNRIGNLARYKADNEARLRLPAGSNDVVFIGSSTIEQWNPLPVKNAVNRGIGNENSAQILSRFQQDVVALKPRIVVLYFGTNDITSGNSQQNFEANVKAIYKAAVAAKIRIIQSSINPVCGAKKTQRPLATISRMNNFLKNQCANEVTCVYANTVSAVADKRGELISNLAKDCELPNANGYKEMTFIFVESVRQVLNLKVTRRADGALVREAIEVTAK